MFVALVVDDGEEVVFQVGDEAYGLDEGVESLEALAAQPLMGFPGYANQEGGVELHDLIVALYHHHFVAVVIHTIYVVFEIGGFPGASAYFEELFRHLVVEFPLGELVEVGESAIDYDHVYFVR